MSRGIEISRAKTISFSMLQNIFSKLHLRDYIVLAAVYNAEEYPQSFTYTSKLAREIGVSKATAMRLLRKLETLGLLRKVVTGYVTEYRPLSQDYGEYVRQKLSMRRAEKRFRQIWVACTRCGALNKARATQTRKKCEKCGWIFWITKNRLRNPEIETPVKSQIARARIAEEAFAEIEPSQAT